MKFVDLKSLPSFEAFEGVLRKPGPWIAGIDFPFGLSRRFIENIGWPTSWQDYVSVASALGQEGFRKALDDYRKGRTLGDREHRRATDVACGSISPRKLHARCGDVLRRRQALGQASVTIPGLSKATWTGSSSKPTPAWWRGGCWNGAATRMTTRVSNPRSSRPQDVPYCKTSRIEPSSTIMGVIVDAPMDLADDPQADTVDALLCAVQAAWAWNHRERRFRLPENFNRLAGWIADPASHGHSASTPPS